MKKQVFKWLLLIMFLIGIPIIVAITVLYMDNGFYLNKFKAWISESSNLAMFVMSCVMYLPLFNGLWKMGLLISQSSRETAIRKEFNNARKNKVIYDDGKNNIISYDEQNCIINLSFKASQKTDLKNLLNQSYVEAKERINEYIKNEKVKV